MVTKFQTEARLPTDEPVIRYRDAVSDLLVGTHSCKVQVD